MVHDCKLPLQPSGRAGYLSHGSAQARAAIGACRRWAATRSAHVGLFREGAARRGTTPSCAEDLCVEPARASWESEWQNTGTRPSACFPRVRFAFDVSDDDVARAVSVSTRTACAPRYGCRGAAPIVYCRDNCPACLLPPPWPHSLIVSAAAAGFQRGPSRHRPAQSQGYLIPGENLATSGFRLLGLASGCLDGAIVPSLRTRTNRQEPCPPPLRKFVSREPRRRVSGEAWTRGVGRCYGSRRTRAAERREGVRSGQASYGYCRRRQRAGASVNPGRVRAKARHQSRPSGWPSASRCAGPSRPQRLSPRGPTADCPVGVSDARPCRCQRPAILSHAARRDSVVTAAMRCIMGLPREVSHVFLGRWCN